MKALIRSFLLIILCLFVSIFSSSNNALSIDDETQRKRCNLRNKDYIPLKHTTSIADFSNVVNAREDINAQQFYTNVLLEKKQNWIILFQDTSKALYLSIILCGVVSIISWIGLMICSIYDYKLLNNTKNKRHLQLLCIGISFISFILTCLLSIIALIDSKNVIQYLNGSSCSLITFFAQTRYGNKELKEKSVNDWKGIIKLTSQIDATILFLEKTKTSYNSIFINHDLKLVEPANNYEVAISDSTRSFFKQIEGPGNGEKIYPLFAFEYQLGSQKQSYVGLINTEFKSTIQWPIQVLSSLKMNSFDVVSKDVIEKTRTISKTLSNLDKLLHQMTLVYSDNFDNYQLAISNKVILIFRIVFGLFTGFIFSMLILISLYIWGNIHWIKIIIHVLWNIILFFIIFGYFIAAFFGLIGYSGKSISPVITRLLSPDYLVSPQSIFSSDQLTTNQLNECLNGEGDLMLSLKIKENQAKVIAQLVQISTQFKSIQSLVQNESFSKIITSIVIPGLFSYESNILKSTNSSYGLNDLSLALSNLNKLSDGDSRCNDVYDYYAISIDQCKEGYIDQSGPAKGKNCYIIQSIDIIPFENYASCAEDIKLEIKTKYNFIADYVSKAIENLDDILNGEMINKDYLPYSYSFEVEYLSLMQNIKQEINNAKGLIDELISIYAPINNEEGVYDMFNCKAIRNNIIDFMDQYVNYVSPYCKTISYCCLFSSILANIGVFFVLVTLNQYSSQSHPRFISMIKAIENLPSNEQLIIEESVKDNTQSIL